MDIPLISVPHLDGQLAEQVSCIAHFVIGSLQLRLHLSHSLLTFLQVTLTRNQGKDVLYLKHYLF